MPTPFYHECVATTHDPADDQTYRLASGSECAGVAHWKVLLDVGCGNGEYIAWVRDYIPGWQTEGVEVNWNTLANRHGIIFIWTYTLDMAAGVSVAKRKLRYDFVLAFARAYV